MSCSVVLMARTWHLPSCVVTAASPTYSPLGVSSLGRYPSDTLELETSIEMGCLVLALIFKIRANGLISRLNALFASCDSPSINGIGVIGFDAMTKVLCLNEICACSCRK